MDIKGNEMKKIIVMIIITLSIMTTSNVLCEESKTTTNSFFNGRIIEKLEKAGEIGDEIFYYYLMGVFDTLKWELGKKFFDEIYPKSNPESIIAAVKSYYRNNTDRLDRPIIDVVLSGCK